jgi:dephospho-CoA kinase
MLRVGLTGDLGSGKSTVARMFAERGAVVFSSDEMARAMMQPGEPVYAAIVERFGNEVVAADGSLDRHKLAQLAFDPENPRVEELNAIVHPAVLEAQAVQIAALTQSKPHAMVVVESALIFSAVHALEGQPWRKRFDRIVLVTAPEEQKIARFLRRIAAGRTLAEPEREALEADARRRLALQTVTPAQAASCVVLRNDGSLEHLAQQAEAVWNELVAHESGA